jgi:hypothetical protein
MEKESVKYKGTLIFMGLGHNGYGPIKAHSILIEINPT